MAPACLRRCGAARGFWIRFVTRLASLRACVQAAECASQAIQLFNTSKAAGRVIPKDELRAIYSHVDSDLFDYIFR